ncbi:expansin EXLX1 family cellulose-binding protein [Actinocorallia longicatena]
MTQSTWFKPMRRASLVLPAAALLACLAAVVTGSAVPGWTATARPVAADGSARAGAPLAGRIKPKVTYRGLATFYAAGKGDGSCMFGPARNMMVAAMNTTDFENAKACGAFIRVTSGGRSITVKVTNSCPTCQARQLDLSAQAFAKLAAPVKGRIAIKWRLLSPKTSLKVSVRYKSGSSRYWCGIQVLDHRNPIAALHVRTSKGWRKLTRTAYNYFLSPKGAGCGKAISATDIYGQKLTFTGVKLRPNVIQRTRFQFSRH